MHQLSPRPRLLRSALAVSVALFGLVHAGCEDDSPTGTAASVVTTVVVAPSTDAMTTVDAATSFTATARDQDGNPMSGQTFTWASSNTIVATVTNAGLVAPVAAGTATITATTAGKSASATVTVTGFGGAYAMGNWANGGISEGTAAIAPNTGPAAEVNFSYSVDLGDDGSGVSLRTASFSVPTPRAGDFVFDWEFTGNHRFFATSALLTFAGVASAEAVNQAEVGAAFTFTGTNTVAVSAGGTFTVSVGGSNFDSNSRINGNLRIFNIRTP